MVVSYWVAPWIAVVLTDSVLRKGQDIAALATNEKRENPAGVLAFVIATAGSIWGFCNQLAYAGPFTGLFGGLGDVTPLVGFVSASVLYVLFSKLFGTDKK